VNFANPPDDPRLPSARPRPLRFMRLYPVEGDTAIAELMLGEVIWGDLRLEGIDLDAFGEARTANSRVVVRLLPDRDSEFDLEQLVALLREAEEWLIENERGRVPLPE